MRNPRRKSATSSPAFSRKPPTKRRRTDPGLACSASLALCLHWRYLRISRRRPRAGSRNSPSPEYAWLSEQPDPPQARLLLPPPSRDGRIRQCDCMSIDTSFCTRRRRWRPRRSRRSCCPRSCIRTCRLPDTPVPCAPPPGRRLRPSARRRSGRRAAARQTDASPSCSSSGCSGSRRRSSPCPAADSSASAPPPARRPAQSTSPQK